MAGYNADEGSILGSTVSPAGPEFGQLHMNDTELHSALIRSYGSEAAAESLLAAYPGLAVQDWAAVASHIRDHMFGAQVDHVTRTHAENGHSAFRYHFRTVPASASQTVGAFHGAELPYVLDFSIPLVPVRDGRANLVAEMTGRWVSFARSGTPNAVGLHEWPEYAPDTCKQMVFDLPEPHVEDCPFEPALNLMRNRIARLVSMASNPG